MQYLNINRSTLDSEAMLDAEVAQRGTWLMLQSYCAGQENNGRIAGARKWDDRKWQQLVRVSLEDINRTCGLWRFVKDDLVAEFYPSAAQVKVQANRYGAALTNGKRRAQRDGERDAERHAKEGMEGKERKKGIAHTNPNLNGELPTKEEWMASAGLLGMDPVAAEEEFENVARVGFQIKPGLFVTRGFLSHHLAFVMKVRARFGKKNGAPGVDLEEIEKKIAQHPANRESAFYNPNHAPEELSALEELKRNRKELLR